MRTRRTLVRVASPPQRPDLAEYLFAVAGVEYAGDEGRAPSA